MCFHRAFLLRSLYSTAAATALFPQVNFLLRSSFRFQLYAMGTGQVSRVAGDGLIRFFQERKREGEREVSKFSGTIS